MSARDGTDPDRPDTDASAAERPDGTLPSTRRQHVIDAIDTLINEVGGQPETLQGRLIRELIQTALRFAQDDADAGELKLVSRSVRELRFALKVFRPYQHRRKVSVFGSARVPPTHPDYHAAARCSEGLSRAGWMVITGAGEGIMRAGHEGAGRDNSFGASIRLPAETGANDIIRGDDKLMTFRYFFNRKLVFVSQADALVLLPGGFGTLDVFLEVLALIQTGKASMIPVVMLEPNGSPYWRALDRTLREQLLTRGMIGPDDTGLYWITDDPDAATRHVLQFYRNYHSQRFVHEHLVFRILHPLSDEELARLNEEFADVVESGRIEQCGPFEEEEACLDLPRLAFPFTRRDHGRLRRMIDRINEMGSGNASSP